MKISRIFKRRRKLNQKGMTLVEVIVAMAILAVVVVPTLHMFISSANANFQSRLRQRATLVGESVMESFKAYNMEALCKQFTTGTFKGVNGATSMTVEASYSSTTGSPFRVDNELDQSASMYTFWAYGVTSEDQTYDVKIEATPIYEQDVLRNEPPNSYTDAIVKLSETLNTEIQTALAGQVQTKFLADMAGKAGLGIDNTKLYDVNRVITFTVDDDGNKQSVKMKIDCTCKAEVKYHYTDAAGVKQTGLTKTYTEADLLPLAVNLPDASSTETEITVYDNDATIKGATFKNRPAKLDSIYLYYYPAYSALYGSGSKDSIVVEGTLTNLYNGSSLMDANAEATGTKPLKLFVAKQLTNSLTTVELNNSEQGYEVSVQNNVSGGGGVSLVSNLRQNLSPLGSPTTPPTIAGFCESDMSIADNLVDEVEFLYSLKVYVYNEGTTKEVAYFEGTTND